MQQYCMQILCYKTLLRTFCLFQRFFRIFSLLRWLRIDRKGLRRTALRHIKHDVKWSPSSAVCSTEKKSCPNLNCSFGRGVSSWERQHFCHRLYTWWHGSIPEKLKVVLNTVKTWFVKKIIFFLLLSPPICVEPKMKTWKKFWSDWQGLRLDMITVSPSIHSLPK